MRFYHMSLPLSRFIILTLIFGLFAGCDFLDEQDAGMFIQTAGVVSTSMDRPSERDTIAEVVIGAFSANPNTCVGKLKVSADREGNNIYLTAEKETSLVSGLVFGACGDAVTEVYGEVTVKNLEVGEYKILDDNSRRELGRFRIEPTWPWAYMVHVDVDAIITEFIASPSPIDPDNYSVHAMLHIAELYEPHCYPLPRLILRTDTEEIEDVINVNIECSVPYIDPGCAVMVNSYPHTEEPSYPRYRYEYNTEVYLGVFSAGSHSVVINGNGRNYLFDIPSGIDEGIQFWKIFPKATSRTAH